MRSRRHVLSSSPIFPLFSSPLSSNTAMADAVLCPPSVDRLVNSLATVALDMKDVSTASTRHARQSLVYPKKRPSPHGISKSHKSPLLPANGASRLSPRAAKAALAQQRQKTAQLLAVRRESVYLEEEYRDEIRRYMHDMEVGFLSSFFVSHRLLTMSSVAEHGVINPINGPAT